MAKRKTYNESIEQIAAKVYTIMYTNKRPLPIVIDDIKAAALKKINTITGASQ